ncbi:MAG: hypothetical protein R2827_14425 [Bdellovibrionales bacterium]
MLIKGRKKIMSIVVAAWFSLGAVFMAGCDEANTDGGQVAIALEYGSFTTAQFKLWDLLIPQAQASVSDLRMCFKRLRFKKAGEEDAADPSLDNDNVDFNLGEVSVTSAGTSLGTVVIPEGEYVRLEFDLESDCAGGYSLLVSNDNGTYSTTDRITIKFEGSFTANSDGTLTLAVQDILNGLNAYAGVGGLKDAAEAISGTL